MICRAHAVAAPGATSAQHALLERYGGAVSRYLLGAVRDPDVAAELAQDFAVRFLRGDFHRADPERGRFRNYLKTAMIHMVTDYRRQQRAQPRPLEHDTPAPDQVDADDDAVFLASWRTELLERTWAALARLHPMQHAVLLLRVSEPELPSPEMAQRVGAALGQPVNAAAARKALQRAHGKFADLLLREVADSLDDSSPEALAEELTALDLFRYCRAAFARFASATNA